ncbi:MAG: transglycosylase domain-containing protein, partial [Saprospiraceae bacterium]
MVAILMPIPDYHPSYSKALYSKEGNLISATISRDQQWCFPMDEKLPDRMIKCIVIFEDEYYYYHPGVNPVSIINAAIANFKARRKVRGASTITMQLMRMKNKNARRSLINKMIETIGALKYSLIHSKAAVIKEWAEIAPFGGNTIGVKAAALRYYGRSVDQLSWGEYAL